MKRTFCITFVFLIICWAVGFFILHASASIHTLAGIAIFMILHLVVKGELLCPPDPSGKDIPCEESLNQSNSVS